MNTSSNAAQTAASATSPISAEPIHFDRPNDIPAERWATMREVVDKNLAGLLQEAYVELEREHHPWCDVTHALDGDGLERVCSTYGTNLTNATYLDEGRVEERGKGWAGWLGAGVDDDLVNLVIEGKPAWAGPDFGSIDFEVPVWQVGVLLEIFKDDRGRDALEGLLRRVREG